MIHSPKTSPGIQGSANHPRFLHVSHEKKPSYNIVVYYWFIIYNRDISRYYRVGHHPLYTQHCSCGYPQGFAFHVFTSPALRTMRNSRRTPKFTTSTPTWTNKGIPNKLEKPTKKQMKGEKLEKMEEHQDAGEKTSGKWPKVLAKKSEWNISNFLLFRSGRVLQAYLHPNHLGASAVIRFLWPLSSLRLCDQV